MASSLKCYALACRLVTGVRGIDAGDLDLPERTTDFGVDVVELEKRVTTVEQALQQTGNNLKAQLTQPGTVKLELLRESILRSAAFGVAGAVPLSAGGDAPADREKLLTQAGSIQKELAQRSEQLTVLVATFDNSTATAETRRDNLVARLRIVFGRGLRRAAPVHAGECRRTGESACRQQQGAGRRSARFDRLVPTHGPCARWDQPAQSRADLCRGAGQRRETEPGHRGASAQRRRSLGRFASQNRTGCAGRQAFHRRASDGAAGCSPAASWAACRRVGRSCPERGRDHGHRLPVRSAKCRALHRPS